MFEKKWARINRWQEKIWLSTKFQFRRNFDQKNVGRRNILAGDQQRCGWGSGWDLGGGSGWGGCLGVGWGLGCGQT